MDNEKLTDLAFEISNSLTGLNENMKSVLDKLTQHESRISHLEQFHTQQPQQPQTKNDDDFKTELLKLLARAVTIGLVVIGSLTGASSIISKIFGA